MINEAEPAIEVMAVIALGMAALGPSPPRGEFAANGSRTTRWCASPLDWLTSECKTSPGNEETARVR